jgi:hypothetical protein
VKPWAIGYVPCGWTLGTKLRVKHPKAWENYGTVGEDLFDVLPSDLAIDPGHVAYVSFARDDISLLQEWLRWWTMQR